MAVSPLNDINFLKSFQFERVLNEGTCSKNNLVFSLLLILSYLVLLRSALQTL